MAEARIIDAAVPPCGCRLYARRGAASKSRSHRFAKGSAKTQDRRRIASSGAQLGIASFAAVGVGLVLVIGACREGILQAIWQICSQEHNSAPKGRHHPLDTQTSQSRLVFFADSEYASACALKLDHLRSLTAAVDLDRSFS